MTRRQKKKLIRILICAVLFLAVSIIVPRVDILESTWYLKLLVYLIPYLYIGWETLWKAFRGIINGQLFDENFLMGIASVGALAIAEYPEAIAVLLFNEIGTLFEEYAVGKSRKSITALMNIRPDFANVERNGDILEVFPDEVQIDDIIVVKPGEKIPLDGIVVEGSTTLDTAALTGESMPRELTIGDEATSGTVNLTGKIKIRVTSLFGESTVSKILDLVENAATKKAKTENFISKFARYYTPSVVGAAVVLAILPSLITGQWSVWIYRALSFLVTSCPCALVISIPLSFFGGIGAASKCGILIKGGNYIEALSRTKTVVFDKTGTLTKGTFHVKEITPANGISKESLLTYAALAESNTTHPIGKSIVEAYGKAIDPARISGVSEISGKGLRCTADGHEILCGNQKLMEAEAISYEPCHTVGTTVYVACNGTFIGSLVIADEVKSDAKEAISALHQLGMEKSVMLTGDTETVGKAVANDLGIREVYTGLLPADKVNKVEDLLKTKPEKSTLAFVGDGINDAPVLSRADVGISMGSIGSDAAVEASDIVLMDDKPSKIATAIKIAKKTMKIVYANISFCLIVKLGVLLFVGLGIFNMWAAVFADVGVSVIAILNAMRLLKLKVK